MRRNGERYKFNPERRALYLEFIRRGYRLGAAAEAIGLTRQIVWHYLQDHPEFQGDIDRAEQDAWEPVEDLLLAKCRQGDMAAIKFALTNRSPDRWKDRRQPTVNIQTPAAPLTSDQLEATAEELLRKLEGKDSDTV